MAFPQVAGTSTGTGASGAGMLITLPAGVTAGDRLVVIAGWDLTIGDAATMGLTGSGWSKRREDLSSANIAAVYEKVADGNDALTVTLSGNGAAELGSYLALRITGHDPAAPVEVASQNHNDVAGTTTATPTPPGLTPSWGADDTLWIAAAAWDNASRSLSAYPVSYVSNLTYADGGAQSAAVGVAAATRELNAATETPGAFTLTAVEQWSAFTIAVKPVAPDAGPVEGTISATTAPAVATIVADVDGAPVEAEIHATTSPAVAVITASGGTTPLQLTLGIYTEVGAKKSGATGLRWVVFAPDLSSIVAHGTGLTTDANGIATVSFASALYAAGDYVPLMIAEYAPELDPWDRVVRSGLFFVPAVSA
jgi:hypothetical protein